MDTNQLSIRIPTEVHLALRLMAAKREIKSINALIVELLIEFVETVKKDTEEV